MVYVISYDLHQPDRDYPSMEAAITSYVKYAHIHGSVWLIVTSKTTAQVHKHLASAVDSNDSIIVSRLMRDITWDKLDIRVDAWLNGLTVTDFN